MHGRPKGPPLAASSATPTDTRELGGEVFGKGMEAKEWEKRFPRPHSFASIPLPNLLRGLVFRFRPITARLPDRGSRRREEKPSAETAQHGAIVPAWGAASGGPGPRYRRRLACEFGRCLAARSDSGRDAPRTRRRDACGTVRWQADRPLSANDGVELEVRQGKLRSGRSNVRLRRVRSALLQTGPSAA